MSATSSGQLQGAAAIPSPAQPPKPRDPAVKEAYVTFKAGEQTELRAALIHMTRHSASIELYTPNTILSTSEILREFTIHFQGQTLYSGQAVVQNVLIAGAKIACDVMLHGTHWPKILTGPRSSTPEIVRRLFKDFLGEWQKFYQISREFKAVVADMQTMLHDLQLWLDQVESELEALPEHERKLTERLLLEEFGKLFVPVFDVLHERLENISAGVMPDQRPAHRVYLQRQLHPLMLCSPFGHRAYAKPLGYAGDYEMVNMIALDPYQGRRFLPKSSICGSFANGRPRPTGTACSICKSFWKPKPCGSAGSTAGRGFSILPAGRRWKSSVSWPSANSATTPRSRWPTSTRKLLIICASLRATSKSGGNWAPRFIFSGKMSTN